MLVSFTGENLKLKELSMFGTICLLIHLIERGIVYLGEFYHLTIRILSWRNSLNFQPCTGTTMLSRYAGSSWKSLASRMSVPAAAWLK
jgi:hypothetical protein